MNPNTDSYIKKYTENTRKQEFWKRSPNPYLAIFANRFKWIITEKYEPEKKPNRTRAYFYLAYRLSAENSKANTPDLFIADCMKKPEADHLLTDRFPQLK